MSKNLIPEIARLSGVEIGEEFKFRIVNSGNEIKHTFRFTEEYLEYYDNDVEDWERVGSPMLAEFIRGEIEIVKLPWKPKCGQHYYTYGRSWNWEIKRFEWKGTSNDCMRKKCGCVFRTEAEALKERPRIYKELTGKDWSE